MGWTRSTLWRSMLLYAFLTAAMIALSWAAPSTFMCAFLGCAVVADKGRAWSARAESLRESRCNLSLEETSTRDGITRLGVVRAAALEEGFRSPFGSSFFGAQGVPLLLLLVSRGRPCAGSSQCTNVVLGSCRHRRGRCDNCRRSDTVSRCRSDDGRGECRRAVGVAKKPQRQLRSRHGPAMPRHTPPFRYAPVGG